MADSELRIVFQDEGGTPSRPSSPAEVPPATGTPPVAPQARPQPAAAESVRAPLTPEQAAELFQKSGLRPERLGLQVQTPQAETPAASSDTTTIRESDTSAEAIRPPAPVAPGPAATPAATVPARAAAPSPEPITAKLVNPERQDRASGRRAPKEDEPEPGLVHKMFATAARQGVSAVTGEVGSVAGPGAGAAAGAAGAEVAGLLAASAPAAIALGAVTIAAGGAAVGIGALADQADKMKSFSAPVAQAAAQNEVRQTMAMLRRAETIGPELGKFEQTKGEINQQASEVYTQAMAVLLRLATLAEQVGLIEFIMDSLRLAEAQGMAMKEAIDVAVAILERDGPGMRKELEEFKVAAGKVTEAAGDFFRDNRTSKNAPIDQLEEMLRNDLLLMASDNPERDKRLRSGRRGKGDGMDTPAAAMGRGGFGV